MTLYSTIWQLIENPKGSFGVLFILIVYSEVVQSI
jgi:hypothetical protein